MSDATPDATDGRTAATTTNRSSTDPEPEVKTAEDGGVKSVDVLADEIDPSDVWDTDHEDLGVYDIQRHRNGDVTVLVLSSFAGGWQALAMDINRDGEVLETEIVGCTQEHSRAVGMCEYWLQQNPKGLLGGEPDEPEGLMAKLGVLFGGGDA